MHRKKLATHARIVMNWHYVFARGGSSFANPNPTAASGRKPLPFFFENNPAARDLFTTYADANLNLLSSNFMTEYVNSTLIPMLYKEHNKDLSEEEQLSLENYLRLNGFLKKNKTARTNVAQGTVLNWMNVLGYKYDRIMKHCFNDKHEDKTNVLYCNDFIKRYFGYERRCFPWIQIKKEEAADMKVHKDYGYSYTTDEGKDMVEYHVDDCEELFQRAQELFDFGCWTNMRTRTKRTRGTENPDAFIRLNMRIVRVAHFSFITQVETQLCIVNRGYAIVTKQQ
jgi:hypothetical protein